MKTITAVRTSLLALAVATSALATTHETSRAYTEPLNQIVAEAKSTQAEAREISSLLKAKTPDLDRVKSKMETLTDHATNLAQHIAALEAHFDELTVRQQQELARMKNVSALLQLFVEQKRLGLEQAEAARNRSLLRAQADGIALRAGMVERSALKLRS
jgi:chromosome segregation ATPase